MSHWIEEFLSVCELEYGLSIHTISAYASDLHTVGQHVSLERATGSQLRQALLEEHVSARTIARRRIALRQFYKFLQKEKVRLDNPAEDLDPPRQSQRLPKILSQDEAVSLIKALRAWDGPRALRLQCFVEVLYGAGLRVSELLGLKLSDLNYEGDTLTVLGKGNKMRRVPLTPMVQEALQIYLRVRTTFLSGTDQGFLFPSRGKQGHLTRQQLFNLLKQLAVEAGIDPKRLSPHVLRHAFATHLVQEGADLVAVQTLLGHQDLATTQIYTHVANRELERVVFEKHPLNRGKPLKV